MSKIDIQHLEQRLLNERERTLATIRQAEREENGGETDVGGELSRTPTHQADLGSDTQRAERTFATVTRASEQLTLIDEALRHLRDDPEGYGACEECGGPIEPLRLDLVPWTRHCAACARAAEAVPRRSA